MDDTYLPRLADTMLDEKLAHARAVVVRGPKWCGKTMTSERHAKSALYLQDPREAQRIRLAVKVDPSLLLDGDRPRLIDEWQDAPQLWDAVRFDADRARTPGQFILTGSATPGESPMHSGTGRFSFLNMRPASATCESMLSS